MSGCGKREPVPADVSEQLTTSLSVPKRTGAPAILPEIPPPIPTAQLLRPIELLISPLGAACIITRNGELILHTNAFSEDGLHPDIAPGVYDLLVSAPGHRIFQEKLELSPQKSPLMISLQPLSGNLKIVSNADVQARVLNASSNVLFEGSTTVYGIIETPLQVGRYTLVLEKKGHYPFQTPIVISQEQECIIQRQLRGAPGSIWIASTRTAEVWQADQFLGMTGTTITNLQPGVHELTLLVSGFRPAQLTVQLAPGGYVPAAAPPLIPAQGALLLRSRSSNPLDTQFGRIEKQAVIASDIHTGILQDTLFENMPCGLTTVQLSAPYYRMEPSSVNIEILDCTTSEVTLVLQPDPAELTITTSPRTALILDAAGQPISATGMPLQIMPFHPANFSIQQDGYASQTLICPALMPGTSTNLLVVLKKIERIDELVVIQALPPPMPAGLAAGSSAAYQRLRQTAQKNNLPAEVRTLKSGITLCLIPPGQFRMGSPRNEAHRNDDEGMLPSEESDIVRPTIRMPLPFYISQTEITQAQWKRVMGSNPAIMKGAGLNAPVESMTWNDCQDFLTKLCQLEQVPDGTYRLPTEAEWEYCCRAGTQTPTYTGTPELLGENNAPQLGELAWYAGNAGVSYDGGWSSAEWPEKELDHRKAGTHPVAQKYPNAWGLYDMLGNVWEWCADRYNSNYTSANATDPAGPDDGNARVCRGGGWYTTPSRCRTAERYRNSPLYCDSSLGLRIVRSCPVRPASGNDQPPLP